MFETNLVLSQRGIRAMPHAIPQTHSSVYCFYPHRFKSEMSSCLSKVDHVTTNAKRSVNLT